MYKIRLRSFVHLIPIALILGFLFSNRSYAEEKTGTNEIYKYTWTLLSTEAIGAQQFLKEHPEYDGRGTVIFILDSGVDPGVAGLQKTTTGEVKVLDVLDFTGQGDIALEVGEAKQEGQESYIEHPDGFKLYNYQNLSYKPLNGEYLIGYIDEARFINSQIDDLNNNFIVDEQFGVLVFPVQKNGATEYLAWLDTDADGHVDDEKPIRDYALYHETFQLRGRNPKLDENLLNFALKINAENMQVSLHFDDSGHGTHVAGIAAGFEINGKKGFHGIAPGAQIISLKIGNNSLAGNATVSGSMRKAFLFGTRWAVQHPETPVVFNLSYSMGVEIADQSDIERFVTVLMQEYPNLVVCLSCGNLGPGISSIGKPASCASAFTTGALLDKTSARDLYGAQLKNDKIFFFSARGGDVAKPDAVAPGVAASTVPPYEVSDKKYGSSMASPQAAGAAALLLSAFKQKKPDLQLTSTLINRSLKYSAKALPDYTFIDQGAGLLDIPNAFKLLEKDIDRKRFEIISDYSISTESPVFASQLGNTAYWRTGGFFPTGSKSQAFTIKPVFHSRANADQKSQFFRAYELVTDESWLQPDKKVIYIRGDDAANVNVNYFPRHIKAPGLYTGKVIAYQKDSTPDAENIEFELLNTIIVPYQFHSINDYCQKITSQQLEPGELKRYFFLVPPGASAMYYEFKPSQNQNCSVYAVIFDPEGRRVALLEEIDSKHKNRITKIFTDDELIPGIWEVVVYSAFTDKQKSVYDLEVHFTGFQITPSTLITFSYEAGNSPKGQFQVTNLFNVPFEGTAQGIIAGYNRTFTRSVRNGDDKLNYHFRVGKDIEKVVFKLNFPDDSFQKFTNIAVNIKDGPGKFLVKEGMTYASSSIAFNSPAAGIYTLEILGAKTYNHNYDDWQVDLTEYYYFSASKRVELAIDQNGRQKFILYPQVMAQFGFTLNEAPEVSPDGYTLFGLVMFKDADAGDIQATLKIDMDTSVR